MYISPYLIEPLFFKFEPVKAEGLEDKIRALMERAGLKVSRVFQVDASRRSRHSNAYFTGIGRVKRIVLFDTLIERMTEDEILAVLAHEVGHWKKRHVLKRILLTEATAFCGLFAAFHLLSWDRLPGWVGLADASFYARVVIIGFLGSLVMFPLTPLFSFLSRKDEREADRFASDLTARPDAMASALVKLSLDNLSNLHPHPLYAKFYYSHPPVVERIRALKERARETKDEK
jgi:STE24 endopeptidase